MAKTPAKIDYDGLSSEKHNYHLATGLYLISYGTYLQWNVIFSFSLLHVFSLTVFIIDTVIGRTDDEQC